MQLRLSTSSRLTMQWNSSIPEFHCNSTPGPARLYSYATGLMPSQLAASFWLTHLGLPLGLKNGSGGRADNRQRREPDDLRLVKIRYPEKCDDMHKHGAAKKPHAPFLFSVILRNGFSGLSDPRKAQDQNCDEEDERRQSSVDPDIYISVRGVKREGAPRTIGGGSQQPPFAEMLYEGADQFRSVVTGRNTENADVRNHIPDRRIHHDLQSDQSEHNAPAKHSRPLAKRPHEYRKHARRVAQHGRTGRARPDHDEGPDRTQESDRFGLALLPKPDEQEARQSQQRCPPGSRVRRRPESGRARWFAFGNRAEPRQVVRRCFLR